MKRDGRIGFLWFLVAGVFLWNPVIGMLDILPDCIGVVLLWIGLSKMIGLHDGLDEATRRLRPVLWLSLGESAATYLLYGVLTGNGAEMNPYERPVLLLVFAFVSFVLQCWFWIPVYRSLFTGLQGLADRYGGMDRGYGRMARLSLWFVILRGICSVLPELTVLTSGNPRFSFDWYAYLDVFRVIAGALAFLIAIVWLIGWLRLFLSMQADLPLRDRIGTALEDHLSLHPESLLNGRVKNAFLLFRIGMLFFVSLAFGGYDLLPEWLCIPFFVGGALMLGKGVANDRLTAWAWGTFAVLGVLHTVLLQIYLRSYRIADAYHYEEAYDRMTLVRIAGVAELVGSLVAVVLLILALRRLLIADTAVNYGESGGELSRRATDRMHREFEPKIRCTVAFAALSTVSKIAVFFLQSDWFWWIPVILTVVTVCIFSSLLSDLSRELIPADSQKSSA